jgi:hypothetical protein
MIERSVNPSYEACTCRGSQSRKWSCHPIHRSRLGDGKVRITANMVLSPFVLDELANWRCDALDKMF